MPEPITGTVLIVTGVLSFFGYLVKKSHDAQKDAADQDLKEKKLNLKAKTMEQARKDNEELTKRDQKIDELIKTNQQKEQSLEEEIKNINKKIKDPNTSEKEKQELTSKLGLLQTQLDEIKNNNKDLFKEKQSISDQIKNNIDIINGIISNLKTDEKS
jgi:uncharacterized protein (DUF3084 family)